MNMEFKEMYLMWKGNTWYATISVYTRKRSGHGNDRGGTSEKAWNFSSRAILVLSVRF